jgi:ATP-dependent DNA helicase PIF1
LTQKEALEILKMGHNVYLTGAAGSGKTYLLNQYISYLHTHNIPVGITASTGIAATHMGGTTIHSWSGIGIKDSLDEKDVRDLLVRQYLRTRFGKTKVLIIDEISMLHAHQLDMVDGILRMFKGNDLPFGGLQIIMCGDFFQLPPVTRNRENPAYVTESAIWQQMDLEVCYLDEQFRQDDRAFLRILNDIRGSEVNEMTAEYLAERLQQDVKGYAKPTKLFTHNADVDAINAVQLDTLEGEVHAYAMQWRGNFNVVEVLKKSCLAPDELILKKGAQVMFVKNNYEAGYVNGTLGEVIGFSESTDENGEGLPIVRTFDGNEITVSSVEWEVKEDNKSLAGIMQIPLRLAWAITVHKSQGMSLDAAEIDLSRSFTPGMGYVALSRVRSLSGLKLMGMNQMALKVNPAVSEMDREFRKRSDEITMWVLSIQKDKKSAKQEEFLAFMKEK